MISLNAPIIEKNHCLFPDTDLPWTLEWECQLCQGFNPLETIIPKTKEVAK
jgi:hypothetical protein